MQKQGNFEKTSFLMKPVKSESDSNKTPGFVSRNIWTVFRLALCTRGSSCGSQKHGSSLWWRNLRFSFILLRKGTPMKIFFQKTKVFLQAKSCPRPFPNFCTLHISQQQKEEIQPGKWLKLSTHKPTKTTGEAYTIKVKFASLAIKSLGKQQ